MNFDVTDDLLRRSTLEWAAEQRKRYPTGPEHPHRFSRRFRRRMEHLCREAERVGPQRVGPQPPGGHRWCTRTAVALLAAALGITVAMAAVNHFRMVRVDHEKYSNIHYEQVEDGYTPDKFITYHITYLPQGFTQTYERTTGKEHHETYTDPEGRGIRLRQLRIDQADLDIDTEKVEPVEILLNGKQRAWYLGNPSLKMIYWDNGIYFFSVSGHVTEDELVKIAESVSKK